MKSFSENRTKIALEMKTKNKTKISRLWRKKSKNKSHGKTSHLKAERSLNRFVRFHGEFFWIISLSLAISSSLILKRFLLASKNEEQKKVDE